MCPPLEDGSFVAGTWLSTFLSPTGEHFLPLASSSVGRRDAHGILEVAELQVRPTHQSLVELYQQY
jgi:hypothetical protein